MRETKYRAWHKKEKKMAFIGILNLMDSSVLPDYSYPQGWEMEDIALMLYSCIKDSQGIDIYEGDILLKPYWDPFADKMLEDKFVVEWRDGGLKARQMKDEFPLVVIDINSEESTIVGNIYEKNT